MTKQDFFSITTIKLLGFLLTIIGASWSYIYTNYQYVHSGYLFEIGELVYLTIWYIAYYGIVPIMFLEFLIYKSRFFTLGNLLFYASMILFNLNFIYNRTQDWIFN